MPANKATLLQSQISPMNMNDLMEMKAIKEEDEISDSVNNPTPADKTRFGTEAQNTMHNTRIMPSKKISEDELSSSES